VVKAPTHSWPRRLDGPREELRNTKLRKCRARVTSIVHTRQECCVGPVRILASLHAFGYRRQLLLAQELERNSSSGKRCQLWDDVTTDASPSSVEASALVISWNSRLSLNQCVLHVSVLLLRHARGQMCRICRSSRACDAHQCRPSHAAASAAHLGLHDWKCFASAYAHSQMVRNEIPEPN